MSTKTKNIIGWVSTALIATVFLMSASMKLSGSPESLKGAASIGLSASVYKLLGIAEVISILLFIMPRTGVFGTLLLAAYLGGAIATHLEHQQSALMPVVLQCFVWITAVIRFPELGVRLLGNSQNV